MIDFANPPVGISSLLHQQTSGSKNYTNLMPVPFSQTLTTTANAKVKELNNRELAERARRYLLIFDSLLPSNENSTNLPPVNLFEGDDGSLLIEWIFPYLRLGISIERQQDESGWFLVSNNLAGNIQISGLLSEQNSRELISGLTSTVFALRAYAARSIAE